MTTVLAAIDNSAACRPVLETARRLAGLLEASIQVVHVREDGSTSALAIAASAGVDVRVLDGDPVEVIVRALDDPDVLLGVVGARGTPADARPAGHAAVAIATATTKPLVVVPPDCRSCGPQVGSRVLVPLDGTEASAQAMQGACELLSSAGVEVVGLHVFDQSTMPRFWDQQAHAAESWRREFGARFLPTSAAPFELRTGRPGERIVDVAEEEQVDLVAMCWSQDMAGGRARTIQDVIEGSHVPVLLLPLAESVTGPLRLAPERRTSPRRREPTRTTGGL